jgi:predicted Ser/Thr protein kinase
MPKKSARISKTYKSHKSPVKKNQKNEKNQKNQKNEKNDVKLLKKSVKIGAKKSPIIKRGKDGAICREKHKNKNVVYKVFGKDKNKKEIKNEIKFMKKGYDLGISPKIYEYDVDVLHPYIVMEEMDRTLFDWMKDDCVISDDFQMQIINILEILDQNRIFHGDVSPLNFMTSHVNPNKLYIIDYGMSKEMNSEFIKEHSEHANIKQGITFFILKIREQNPNFQPKLLLDKVMNTLSL